MPSLNRRHFLRSVGRCGLAAASVAALPAWSRSALAQTNLPQGFSRQFTDLTPARFDPADLARLALGDGKGLTGMTAEPELLRDARDQPLRDTRGYLIASATPENEQDDEENFAIPAGYTYLGQFVDHDITHNPLGGFGPVEGTVPNLRSAALDLDCLYAGGPSQQPYLYAADGRSLLRGRSLTRAGRPGPHRDLPRLAGRAAIGDKRNDENVIVSQLHGVFADFHNAVVRDRPMADFDTVRREVIWHYQWMILTDFLPRLVGADQIAALLPGFGENGRLGQPRPQRSFTRTLAPGMIPMEFTDAAYRFGHSMVRSTYRLNLAMAGTAEEQRLNPALAGRRNIFAALDSAGLNGFREFPEGWAIDWELYFETRNRLELSRVTDGRQRVQAAYKFDTSLTNPLAFLPEFSTTDAQGRLTRDRDGFPAAQPGVPANLALRNLLRGQQRGLPSGQDVARALGIDPLKDDDIRIGKANLDGLAENRAITDYGDSFRGKAPLWTYVLAEAQHDWNQLARASQGSDAERDALPSRLGPVGGRLVAETFIALLDNDPQSVLHAPATWQPAYGDNSRFSMVELLKVAGLA